MAAIKAGGLIGLALSLSAGLAGCSSAEALASKTPRSGEEAAAPADTRSEAKSAGNLTTQPVDPSFEIAGAFIQGGYIRGTVPAGTDAARFAGEPLQIAPDGSFFAAFDRDAPGALSLEAELKTGDTVRRALEIAPRDWQIERVNIAKRSGGASDAWWQKRKPEWEAITAARARQTGASGWQQDFIWPVKGRISGHFGRQRIYRGEPGSYHTGIDIAPGHGVPFKAPANGIVVLARSGFSLEGGLIIIDHGMGLNSAFLHASKILVSEGDKVKQGAVIGRVGSSGRATGPHLHWSLKWNDARLDPLLFTGPMP